MCRSPEPAALGMLIYRKALKSNTPGMLSQALSQERKADV